jgi:uncharacterized coiled-coil DUF342 family protein
VGERIVNIEEILAEIVKNAVSEALVDLNAKIDAIEEKADAIREDIRTLPEPATVDDITEAIADGLDELHAEIQRADLNRGRDELRQARLMGKAS